VSVTESGCNDEALTRGLVEAVAKGQESQDSAREAIQVGLVEGVEVRTLRLELNSGMGTYW
jgi:hypothetical protein